MPGFTHLSHRGCSLHRCTGSSRKPWRNRVIISASRNPHSNRKIKRCRPEAQAVVTTWGDSYASNEEEEEEEEALEEPESESIARGGGRVSRYDSGPDIFDDDFPYSVAEMRTGEAEAEEPTEMIFELNRRGYGWGEEIIPMVTMERRPLRQKPGNRNRSKTPTPWEKGSLEAGLSEAGVPMEQVESVAAAAAAWRVTPGGRPLIDRWRRTRATRNLPIVIDYLITVCGLEPGAEDVGAVLTKSPQILLANPKQHDRWFRRVVELGAFLHRYGHCNVPEKWPENPNLSFWAARLQRSQNSLSEERLQILYALGFEFGEVIGINQEWESYFDMLVEWLMWHREQKIPIDWNGLDWVKKGGPRAGQLAAWVQLQREARARKLLHQDAINRLNALGFRWAVCGQRSQTAWMENFGQLMIAVEKRRRRSRRQGAFSPNDIDIQGDAGSASVLDVFSENTQIAASATWSGKEMERYSFYRPECNQRSKEAAKTMRLDRLSGIQVGSATAYWLTKQRWLWRRGKMEPSKATLMYSAGIDLNLYGVQEWVAFAQKAANYLNGYEIWVMNPEGKSADLKSDKKDSDKRLFVHAPEIKEILSAGGVLEWQRMTTRSTTTENSSGSPGSNEEDKEPTPPRVQKGSLRASIRRWVQSQQVLWRENRLSQEQLRHLAFLGLTWILSLKVTSMSDKSWKARYCEVINIAQDLSYMDKVRIPPRLWDWLMYQRALRRLGWLSQNRIDMLDELRFDWTFNNRSEEERRWDANLAELLEFKKEHQHCQVPKTHQISQWLLQQQKKLEDGNLSALRWAQLEAIDATRTLKTKTQFWHSHQS